jgi:hypothetical protein
MGAILSVDRKPQGEAFSGEPAAELGVPVRSKWLESVR